MREIKIGDIITPITPLRHIQYGNGIVVGAKQANKKPVSVVFIGDGGFVDTFDFKEEHVKVIEVSEKERKMLLNASYTYKQMLSELNSA